MKKRVKVILTTLCLVAAMTFVIPTTALAADSDPQGATKTTTAPPPPPPPSVDLIKLFMALITVI
ncbi:MAG TPA: hypothetical protein VIX17_05895 [Pyrinomonadaceae bacterium]